MTFAITIITGAIVVAIYAVSMSVDKQPPPREAGDVDRNIHD
jgi:hypothetical protein